MLERDIEKYLRQQVKRAGGEIKKLTGRINDPDRLVIWPGSGYSPARYIFVECKAPGEKPRRGQVRELKRLDALGCIALVCDSKQWVDDFVEAWRHRD